MVRRDLLALASPLPPCRVVATPAAADPAPCAGPCRPATPPGSPGARPSASGPRRPRTPPAPRPRRPRHHRRGDSRWRPLATSGPGRPAPGPASAPAPELDQRTDLDRAPPLADGGNGGRPFHGVVEVGAVEQEVPSDLFLDLGERSVGEQCLTVAQRHRGGGAGWLQGPATEVHTGLGHGPMHRGEVGAVFGPRDEVFPGVDETQVLHRSPLLSPAPVGTDNR